MDGWMDVTTKRVQTTFGAIKILIPEGTKFQPYIIAIFPLQKKVMIFSSVITTSLSLYSPLQLHDTLRARAHIHQDTSDQPHGLL